MNEQADKRWSQDEWVLRGRNSRWFPFVAIAGLGFTWLCILGFKVEKPNFIVFWYSLSLTFIGWAYKEQFEIPRSRSEKMDSDAKAFLSTYAAYSKQASPSFAETYHLAYHLSSMARCHFTFAYGPNRYFRIRQVADRVFLELEGQLNRFDQAERAQIVWALNDFKQLGSIKQ